MVLLTCLLKTNAFAYAVHITNIIFQSKNGLSAATHSQQHRIGRMVSSVGFQILNIPTSRGNMICQIPKFVLEIKA